MGVQRRISIEASWDEDRARICRAERPRTGEPLSEDGLGGDSPRHRGRAGLTHARCHELRRTCSTRLREAGMAFEALQVQAGRRSIETDPALPAPSNECLTD